MAVGLATGGAEATQTATTLPTALTATETGMPSATYGMDTPTTGGDASGKMRWPIPR